MKFYHLFLLSSLLFVSCEKVIKVDLNESNPKIVILANYDGDEELVEVQLSLTSSYFDNSTSPTVDNATVTIKDQNGNSANVPSVGNGLFRLTNYTPIVNNTYTISVVYDGVEYLASSNIPLTVNQDSVVTEVEMEENEIGDIEEFIVAFYNFSDPSGTTNFYQIVTKVNGLETARSLQDDKFIDGSYISDFAYAGLNIGDTLNVALRSITEKTFDYYTELESLNDGESAAPANPTYQWSNNALGYFSAFGSSTQEVIVQ